MMSKPLKILAAVTVNWCTSVATFFVGLNFGYPVLIFLTGRQGEPYYLLSMIPVYAVAGALMVLWTRSVLVLIVPACAGFFCALAGFKWAIYLTDMGDASPSPPPLTKYLFSMSTLEALVGIAATMVAAGVYVVVVRLKSRRTQTS